jgi:hypothetical protein
MPRLHAEPLLFCLAWAALAVAGAYWGNIWAGILLSVGLLVLISAASLQVLAQTGDPALERQVRWGIWVVAALGLAAYLNAFG